MWSIIVGIFNLIALNEVVGNEPNIHIRNDYLVACAVLSLFVYFCEINILS